MKTLKQRVIEGIFNLGIGLVPLSGCSQVVQTENSPEFSKPEHKQQYQIEIQQAFRQNASGEEVTFSRSCGEYSGVYADTVSRVFLENKTEITDGRPYGVVDGKIDRILYVYFDRNTLRLVEEELHRKKDYVQHKSEFDREDNVMFETRKQFAEILNFRYSEDFSRNKNWIKRTFPNMSQILYHGEPKLDWVDLRYSP